jgi:hypothetical protein
MNVQTFASMFKFTDALRNFNLHVENDVVYISGDNDYGTLRYRVEQSPRILRGYEPRIEWLPTKELTPRRSLATFAEIERQYAEARGRDPPTGYELARRMAKYVANFDTDAEFERWVSEFESQPDRFVLSPTDRRDDARLASVLENRPPWQLRQMRLALRLGWYPAKFGKL